MQDERIRVDRAGATEAVRELLVREGWSTRWLESQLTWLNPGGRRVLVGGGSNFKVGGFVVEQTFVEFLDELVRGNFLKCHEPSLLVPCHGEVALE
jgi:hypothetical protein